MINQLFQTKLVSNLTPFIVFLTLNALLGLILISIHDDTPPPLGYFSAVIAWLLCFPLAAGGLALLRYNRERHTRLYALLPATSLQVRLAFWCHGCLYLCIASLMLLLVMIFEAQLPVLTLLQFTLLFFSHAGVLLAVISIVTSNTLSLVPKEIRKRTFLYFLLATFITFLFMFGIGLIVAGYIHLNEQGVENWLQLTLLMTLLCAGLVTLDIHLFRHKDSYLE